MAKKIFVGTEPEMVAETEVVPAVGVFVEGENVTVAPPEVSPLLWKF